MARISTWRRHAASDRCGDGSFVVFRRIADSCVHLADWRVSRPLESLSPLPCP